MTPDHSSKPTDLAPIEQSQRIDLIDSLRGLAVLGILLLNITSFGLPSGSAEDPTILQNKGLNFYCWYIFGHGVFEGSFRAIFSMLFGASTLIFIARLEKKLNGQLPTEYFVRRQLWLLMFGLINAFIFLWPGDILFHYALCGVVLLAFKSVSPRNLLIASAVCVLLLTIRSNKDFFEEKRQITKGEQLAVLDTSVVKLTSMQKESVAKMQAIKNKYSSLKRKENIEWEKRIFRGGYLTLYKYISDKSLAAETTSLYYFHFFDILIFMLIGMAFFKLGIIQGNAPLKIYGWMAATGLIAGLILSYLFLKPSLKYNFEHYEVIKHKYFEIYEIQRFVRSIGVFGLIMLAFKSGFLKRVFSWMRPVGQMAFTNYLAQSVICAFIFYGFGMGKFGQLERYQLYYVVLTIWIIQIGWSHFWLKYFRYGPLEWLWRCLTYWKILTIKKPESRIAIS
jgi:uncharacterized protein